MRADRLPLRRAHYQLGQLISSSGDGSRAFQELSRSVDLAPDNYRAIDLAISWSRRAIPMALPCRLHEAGRVHLDPSTKSSRRIRKSLRPGRLLLRSEQCRRGSAGDAESNRRRPQPIGVLPESGSAATSFQPAGSSRGQFQKSRRP